MTKLSSMNRTNENRAEFDYRWCNASTILKSELIKAAMETKFGIHYDSSKAITNWNNQSLEKMPIFLRNGIALELMFGNPKFKKEFLETVTN